MSLLLPERERFSSRLKCGRCGAEGHAVWEENSAVTPQGPMGVLVSISSNFAQVTSHGAQGQPVIACIACGLSQPG